MLGARAGSGPDGKSRHAYRAGLGAAGGGAAAAGAAVERLRGLGNPKAGWYAHHLANYRSGGRWAASRRDRGSRASGRPVHRRRRAGGAPPTGGRVSGSRNRPRLIRMALTAAKAMAAFVGTGFKTATPERYRSRLTACAACAHLTGFAAGFAAASPRPSADAPRALPRRALAGLIRRRRGPLSRAASGQIRRMFWRT